MIDYPAFCMNEGTALACLENVNVVKYILLVKMCQKIIFRKRNC